MYINVHNVNYCSLNPIPIVPITKDVTKDVLAESAASSVNVTSRQVVERAGTSRYWKGRYCAEGGHENGNLYYERTKE